MAEKYFAVKTIYLIESKTKPKFKDKFFKETSVLMEERILLIKARNHEQSIRIAEQEARKYSRNYNVINIYGQRLEMSFTGIVDSYELYDRFENMCEVFSTTRVLERKLTKKQLAELMLGKFEGQKDLEYRKKFRSK